MMDTDEMVKLARKIAGRLVGVTPSEWTKWSRYAARNGLDKAIEFANAMTKSSSLRPALCRAYSSIRNTVVQFRRALNALTNPQLSQIFGYVRQALVARLAGTNH
ncbi:MAG: hypothetical protein NZ959_05765 [Armatimonadetes bacterium]|nr:hypothetical protein [Armatimonadota bacterium]MDW8122433.1 hypothetical protein [Armatimonadota bacterium]